MKFQMTGEVSCVQVKELEKKAIEIRKKTLTMIYTAKAGHLGGTMSMVDILVTLFYDRMKYDPKNPKMEDRDRFVLSKGHSVESYYNVLADTGFFNPKELESYSKYGSKFIGHPTNKVPGIEICTGALGHGLSCAVGMALGSKMNHMGNYTYVIMGDGELAEGSIWEGAMAAANYELDHLIGIVDRNMLQISGCTEDVMKLENLADKWRSFGWNVKEIDGNSIPEIQKAFAEIPFEKGKPNLILAHTIKAKGICFAENIAKWHHGVPNEEQYKEAMEELDRAERRLEE